MIYSKDDFKLNFKEMKEKQKIFSHCKNYKNSLT